ncbi:Gfo/Idh/MocA family protein [Polymorphospora rubra]|uniref:Gfo/Idh/MocA family protein n=1 Tax=Polymorphospora rubra TaxID=338584 RepID=UPI0033FBF0B1
MTTPTVALIGASGHGLWHRRALAPLHEAGRLRLVALVDVRPVEAAPDAPVPEGVGIFTDHREMLRTTRPDVVVICTPAHTHLPIALDCVAAGADLLLEKPPVLSLAEHATLAEALAAAGRACQVGFQALGSAALTELRRAVAAGAVGTVTGIAAVASWRRDDAYYARSSWAGRRAVDGRPVLDGALVNPLAHAVMQSLAVAGECVPGRPVSVEVERYRTRPIEVDDTATMRVTLDGGLPVVVAVTLAGEDFIPGEVIVHGTAGRAVLEYPTDRLRLPGDAAARQVPGRVGLLENLLAHRADPAGVPLIAPLATTAAFTAVVEAIVAGPEPTLVDAVPVGDGPARVRVIEGIDGALRLAGERMALLSELGVAWARPPFRTELAGHPDPVGRGG